MLLNTVIGTAFVLSRYALAYPQASPAADPVITKPDFTSHFLGDERGDVKDDQDLVNLEGGNRRLRKLEIWCGPSVNQMIPTYSNKAGTDHKAWPWGSLARGGSYLSMDINPGETIQYLKLERCNIGGTSLETADWRICFFHATKGPISGGPSKDPNSEIKCGFSQGIPYPWTQIVVSGDSYYNNGINFSLLSFTGNADAEGITGISSNWLQNVKY